ncbi:MAG: nucleotidyltransferase domain-containing protein [Syntrophaceae bacterium]|nr:nucleotidyltransferase domain-containing protein [Syntrophaceae bacterium]
MNKTIEKIFGSRIRAKILGWLFTHPDESFFVRQMAVILKEDPTNVGREMARLGEMGILRSKRNGNLKHFQANQECPFFEELKGLVLKTSGVAGRIRASLGRLAGIEFALIYGSYAKGEEKPDSDIDLLIIGDVDLNRLDASLGKLEKILGREINYVLYSREEFKAKKKSKDGFLMDVLSGKKIMLAGVENGLEAP